MNGVSGTQVNIPPLVQINTSNMKNPRVNPTSQFVFTDGKQLQTRCVLPTDTTNKTIKSVVTNTNKVSVDGKIVGIDVLTKLQQQNVGNIVSFTASKEFISNLTNPKLSINKVTSTASTTNKKKIDSSVFRLNNVNNITTLNVSTYNNKGNILKSQEKLLLPKTISTKCEINGKISQNIEVKKFVPEMTGLLTGLSTALKTTTQSCVQPTTTSQQQQQQKQQQQQSTQVLRTNNIYPMLEKHLRQPTAVANVTQTSGKSSLLIAVKTTQSLGVPTKALPAISTFKTSIPAKRPVIQQQQKFVQTQNIQFPTSVTSVATTTAQQQKKTILNLSKQIRPTVTKSYYQKASTISANIDSSRINMFLKPTTQANKIPTTLQQLTNSNTTLQHDYATKCNRIINSTTESKKAIPTKVVTTLINWGRNTKPTLIQQSTNINHVIKPTNQKPTTINYQSQYIDVRSQQSNKNMATTTTTTMMSKNQKENKNKDDRDSPLCGFTELYEKAIRNVLNIKAFPDEIIENQKTKNELERTSYQNYLQAPTEYEKKLKREFSMVFGDSMKNVQDNHEPKRMKIDHLASTFQYHLPKLSPTLSQPSPKISKSQSNSPKHLFNFDKFTLDHGKAPTKREVDLENLKFFSQFLAEQKSTHLEKLRPPFYPSAEYPWLHPMYSCDHYYPMAPYLPSMPPYYPPRDFTSAFPPKLTKSSELLKPLENKNTNTDRAKDEEKSPDIDTKKMKLNTVKTTRNRTKKEKQNEAKTKLTTNESKVKVSPDEEVKKINKSKTKEKTKGTNSNRSTPLSEKEKKEKAKEVLKIKRYTLRQRALALKKAKKLAIEMPKEPPKYILKEITGKNVTKKEHFLGVFGLRRILKRLDKKNVKDEK